MLAIGEWLQGLCARRSYHAPVQLVPVCGPPPLPPRARQVDSFETKEPLLEKTVGAPVLQESSEARSVTELLDEALEAATKASKAAEMRLVRLKDQICDPGEAERWRRCGRALSQAPEEAWNEGLRSIVLPNPGASCQNSAERSERATSDGSASHERKIEVKLLKPGQDFQKNADLSFKNADKIEKTNARCTSLIAETQAEISRWSSAVDDLTRCQSTLGSVADVEVEIRKLHEELCSAGHIKVKPVDQPEPSPTERRRKYGKEIDCFVSPSGYEVIAGRSAGANERVSFELTPKDSFWFHSDCGVPGSHVAILFPADEVATLEDVEFAASIAAWHSKAREHPVAAVCYCYGSQIGRPRVPKLGQVVIRGGRGQLHVTPALPATQA